jgi:hypothetical protein
MSKKPIEVKYEELKQYDFNEWRNILTTKREAHYAFHNGIL